MDLCRLCRACSLQIHSTALPHGPQSASNLPDTLPSATQKKGEHRHAAVPLSVSSWVEKQIKKSRNLNDDGGKACKPAMEAIS